MVALDELQALLRPTGPAEPQSATRPITNLCGFWNRILDDAIKATEEYPFECTITFYRGDLFLIARVLGRILNGPQRDWLTEPAKKALVELHNFFNDRLYDPALVQGIGAPYRREEALLNDFYVGKKTAIKPQNIVSPTPQRIIVFGVVLALLMPAERQPFSITSVADLMADLFRWNPVRTLEEINTCLELCGRDSDYKLEYHKDECGLIHMTLPKKLVFGPEALDLKPIPTPRAIIAFAVAMALLVPEQNRRRQLALQSVALLMHDLFGWSHERAAEEINICVQTWNEDGVIPNFWTDEAGLVHVGLPKKPSSY